MLGLSREGFTWFEPLMQDFFFLFIFCLMKLPHMYNIVNIKYEHRGR